jgi:hypothetical protein
MFSYELLCYLFSSSSSQDCGPAREFAALGLPVVVVRDVTSESVPSALLERWLGAHCSASLADVSLARWLQWDRAAPSSPLEPDMVSAGVDAGGGAMPPTPAAAPAATAAGWRRCPPELRLNVSGLGRDPETWPWSRAH